MYNLVKKRSPSKSIAQMHSKFKKQVQKMNLTKKQEKNIHAEAQAKITKVFRELIAEYSETKNSNEVSKGYHYLVRHI